MRYYPISESEFHSFLAPQGFQKINLPNVREVVYAKIVAPGFSYRIYTGVVAGESREVGQDAIRPVLFWRKDANSQPVIVADDTKCLRVEGWKTNLQDRINRAATLIPPNCPKCGAPMKKRKGKNGEFWGCSQYPNCYGTRQID